LDANNDAAAESYNKTRIEVHVPTDKAAFQAMAGLGNNPVQVLRA
jgi:hypothetical protein